MVTYASFHSITGLLKKKCIIYWLQEPTSWNHRIAEWLGLERTAYLHFNPLDVYPTIFSVQLNLRLFDNLRRKQNEKMRLQGKLTRSPVHYGCAYSTKDKSARHPAHVLNLLSPFTELTD